MGPRAESDRSEEVLREHAEGRMPPAPARPGELTPDAMRTLIVKLQTQNEALRRTQMACPGPMGGLAQDLNNILGAILALATANRQLHASGSQAGLAFGTIAEAAERGGRMVEGMLATARPAPAEPLPARTLKVLLVDDDELVRRSTRMLITVMGHDATLAASGEEALALLGSGLRPDVVVLDMNMPGLGGAGTLPRLRALNPTVPVLLATGRADPEVLGLIDAHPGVTLLSKPFSFGELKEHLEGA